MRSKLLPGERGSTRSSYEAGGLGEAGEGKGELDVVAAELAVAIIGVWGIGGIDGG